MSKRLGGEGAVDHRLRIHPESGGNDFFLDNRVNRELNRAPGHRKWLGEHQDDRRRSPADYMTGVGVKTFLIFCNECHDHQ